MHKTGFALLWTFVAAAASMGNLTLTASQYGMLGSPNCDTHTTCETCTRAKSWEGSNCRWCPTDGQCHAWSSLSNKCSAATQRTDPTTCGAVPAQVHLSLAGPGGMRVSWFTWNTAGSAVRYRSESSTDVTTIVGATPAVEYLAGYGFHHSVKIGGLVGSTHYVYSVGNPSTDEWSTDFNFTSAPDLSKRRDIPFSISIFGDLGYEDSEQRPMVLPAVGGLKKHWSAQFSRDRLLALRQEGEIDLVWHLGDIGYADDSFAHNPVSFQYEAAYSGYVNWLQPLISAVPYMTSPGNHESECHSPAAVLSSGTAKTLSNFSAYNARWRMPAEESASRAGQSMWYSFDYGAVHFVSINSETDWGCPWCSLGDSGNKHLPAGGFGRDGEYLAWLKADLEAANEARKKTGWPRWIVAGGHRPQEDIQGVHTDMFAEYGVDLYVAGHAHSYSRLAKPMNGTVYIVVGGAGCEEMADGQDGFGLQVSAESLDYNHYATGVLDVNSTGLHWRLVDSRNGTTVDSVSIK